MKKKCVEKPPKLAEELKAIYTAAIEKDNKRITTQSFRRKAFAALCDEMFTVLAKQARKDAEKWHARFGDFVQCSEILEALRKSLGSTLLRENNRKLPEGTASNIVNRFGKKEFLRAAEKTAARLKDEGFCGIEFEIKPEMGSDCGSVHIVFALPLAKN